MRVLVSGATGMVGRALVEHLAKPTLANNFAPEVFSLVRRTTGLKPNEISWDPYEHRIDIKRLEGFDAVVHLAGENVGSGEGLLAFTGRWSEHKKHMIMESRRRGTTLLARALASVEKKPKVLVSASGIGYYGDSGEAFVTERSTQGGGFLADVAGVWEASTARAADAGIRVVNMRFGVVLSTSGGVLQKLYWPFFLGGGGPVGSGQQYMSWITLRDAVRSIEYAMIKPDLVGPVNACAPGSCTNAEFMRAFAAAMGRPAFVPLPELAVKAIFGEMGLETLLAGQRGVPEKLTASGFKFLDEEVRPAMRTALQQ